MLMGWGLPADAGASGCSLLQVLVVTMWLLQTRLALLEQGKHTINTSIASGGSGGETPLTFLSAKAVFMGETFAVAVWGLCVGLRRVLRVLFRSEKEQWTFSQALKSSQSCYDTQLLQASFCCIPFPRFPVSW